LPDFYNAWPDTEQRPKKQDMSGEIRMSGNPTHEACINTRKHTQYFYGEGKENLGKTWAGIVRSFIWQELTQRVSYFLAQSSSFMICPFSPYVSSVFISIYECGLCSRHFFDIPKEDSVSSSKVVNCVGAISEAIGKLFHYS
jgi:hypothetical protein